MHPALRFALLARAETAIWVVLALSCVAVWFSTTRLQFAVWLCILTFSVSVFLLNKHSPLQVEPTPTEPPSPFNPDDQRTNWIELLKLEYENAADRYENIYKAIWQNFSYMALVAGGILTFGGKELEVRSLLYFLALSPLFFWLVATFLPLNHYGESIRTRLRQIEDDINRVYFSGRDDPKLAHFKLFEGTHYRWRVRTAVGIFGVLIGVAWSVSGVVAGSQLFSTNKPSSVKPLQLRLEPLQVNPRDLQEHVLRDSVAQLSGIIRSLDSLVRARLPATQVQTGQDSTSKP
jgi:hypothetical protein